MHFFKKKLQKRGQIVYFKYNFDILIGVAWFDVVASNFDIVLNESIIEEDEGSRARRE